MKITHNNLTAAHPGNSIPERSPEAAVQQINLDALYNHALNDDIHHKPDNTLSSLPSGIQNLGGVSWDIRGLIQLSGLNSDSITSLVYPDKVEGIRIGQRAKTLHFLHGSAWNIDAPEMEIGSYKIHFKDGTSEKIPVIYRRNIWDWWGTENEPETSPVWTGKNPRTSERNMHIRLYQMDWNNPKPHLEVKTMDLVSNNKGPGLFIVAISLSN